MGDRRRLTLFAVSLCLAVVAAATAAAHGLDPPTRGGHDLKRSHQPYFPGSFFTHRLPDDAVIDRGSAELVREVRNMAFGVAPSTVFNCRHAVMNDPSTWTAEESANCAEVVTPAGIIADAGAAVYKVPADQPRVPVAIDNPNPNLRRAMAAGVPIPAGAEPALSGDGQLIIWQAATDTMWELFQARSERDGWHAGYGGRIRDVSENPGHYRDVPDPARPDLYREQHTWGETASSIPSLPGLITLQDVRARKIDHALVFSTWVNAPGTWVYPAQRTDGACREGYCSQIPQGARFRLPPGFKVARLEHPLVRMIARAVKNYGMVLDNKTRGGLGFYAEGWIQHDIGDPWRSPGGLFVADPEQLHPTQFMREFPWERLQMLKRGTTCSDVSVECPAPKWWPVKRDR